MSETTVKAEALPDLDDLLQCPVCYEIPTGQIFQCNEGHHVCGRCKMRLDVCPVCRALFFGTRNYAMEELIANVRKLRAFKLGGKVTTGSSSESNTPAIEESTSEPENVSAEDDENNLNFASRPSFRAPQACKGLFRCLCCKNGNSERLPAGRLLNHLRYYHSPELIEGQSDNGEYLQAWQFSTAPGRIVTAVRVADMGIFFLIIEINVDTVCAWLTMAASPWVAHEFCYTVTISGNDREAIFSDCVWSVRACEGSLKKRGHCLVVNGLDARALTAPAAISGKLSVRRVPPDQLAQQSQPRAVLRVASRGAAATRAPVAQDFEPFLQDLQNDVARLSRAFATLGMEANALVRSEAEMRARIENGTRNNQPIATPDRASLPASQAVAPPPAPVANDNAERGLSRSARRRMRQRLRAALDETRPSSEQSQSARAAPVQLPQAAPVQPQRAVNVQPPQAAPVQPPRAVNVQPPRAAPVQPQRAVNVQPPRAAPVQPQRAVNVQLPQAVPVQPPRAVNVQPPRAAPVQPQQPRSSAQVTTTQRQNGANEDVPVFRVGFITVEPAAPAPPPPAPSQSSSGHQSSGASQSDGNQTRASKKKRRQRKHN